MSRTVPILASLAATMLLATGVAVVATSQPVHAAFPGANGKIAFVSDPQFSGDSDIWVINPDRSGRARLINNPANDSDPAFSSDGSKIVFVSDREGNQELYVMDSSGSNPTPLTNTSSANEDDPAFSPDGSKLAFTHEHTCGEVPCPQGKYAFASTTQGRSRLL